MPSNAGRKHEKLAREEREALGMLAASLRGRLESIMQAHGFGAEILHRLVREGLAAEDREPAYFNQRATVMTLQITDAGRRAIGI